jgi:hypothetical protein
MKRRTKLGLLLSISATCGVLITVLSSHGAAPPPPAADVMVHRTAFTIGQLYADGQAKAGGKAERGDHEQIEPQASMVGVDDAIEGVLASDPQLHKFYKLRRKALRSSAEQQAYLDMISDPKTIDAARAELLAATSQHELDQDQELRRLQRIDFLNSALAWKDNPARPQALSAVSDVVVAELPEQVPDSVAGSVLGDKFDLFQLVMASDPDKARALLAQAHGTASEKVLLLAWGTSSAPK